jgi:hypothetical protein
MLHTSSAPAHIVIWRTNIAEGFAPQESGCFQLSHSLRRIRLRGRMVGSGCISILSGGCINYKERRGVAQAGDTACGHRRLKNPRRLLSPNHTAMNLR